MKKTNIKEIKTEELENINGGGWIQDWGKAFLGGIIPGGNVVPVGGPAGVFYK